jgi:hypothetical protein
MGKKFLTVDEQEEIGVLSPEVRACLAENYRNGGDAPAARAHLLKPHHPGRPRCSTRSNAQECAKCGGGWCGPAVATPAGIAGLTPAALIAS